MRITRTARVCGFFLLLVWVGPVSFLQADACRLAKLLGAPQRASASSRTIPAGEALIVEPGARMTLTLRDGSVVQGRFLERAQLDSAVYASRFAAYAETSSFVPIALGETLTVVYQDGQERTAPFAGYGALTLLLESSQPQRPFRVPFESAFEVRRAGGAIVDLGELARAFRAGALPSAEAVVLDGGKPQVLERAMGHRGGRFLVALEDIESASVELSSNGQKVVGVVFVTVLLTTVLVLWVVWSVLDSAFNDCGSAPVVVDF